MLKYIDFKNTNPQIQVQEATTYGVCTSHPSKPIKKHLKFEKTCPKVMMQARTSGTDVWLKTTLSHLHVAIHKSCCPHSTAGVIWCYRSRSWWAPVAASWRTSVRWRTAGWHRPISSAAAVQRTPWWVSWRIWTSPVWWISWRISWWTPPAFIITSPPTKPTHITRWICRFSRAPDTPHSKILARGRRPCTLPLCLYRTQGLVIIPECLHIMAQNWEKGFAGLPSLN